MITVANYYSSVSSENNYTLEEESMEKMGGRIVTEGTLK